MRQHPFERFIHSICFFAICGTIIVCLAGCFAPCSVNVFSSRMVVQQCGTNGATQDIEGGANLASNNVAATIPLK